MKKLFATGAVALVLSLAACGGGSGGSGSVDTETLDIAWNAQPPTLDPLMTTATSTRDIARNVWEPLVAPDENGEMQPVLAESYTVSEDGKTVSFVLREGVTFHNGDPMTADDVVASVQRWIEKTGSGSQYFADATVEKVDETTVNIVLPEAMYTALDLIGDPSQIMAVMPKSVIDAAPTEGVSEYVGTGPYSVVEWATDQHVHLEKFAEYTSPEGDPSFTAGAKTPVFENIMFHFVTDPSTRLSGMQSGEYDIANEMNFDMKAQLDGDPNLVTEADVVGFNGVIFNKKEGVMSDVNMRQAVLSSLDMTSILQASFADPEFFTENGALMAEGQPYYTDAGLENWNNPDPERVKQLLAEAGYNNEPVRILTTREYADHYNAAVVVEQNLKANGINASLEVYDWPTVLSTRTDSTAYEIFITGFSTVTVPTNYVFFGPEWPGWTNDPAITQALDDITYAADEAAATAAGEELQTAFYEYLPIAKFGDNDTLTTYSGDLTGYSFDPTAGIVVYNTAPAE
ncbi:ABC transporter substrate-binding protein [Brevibacterium samyangense]|uniref:ABC transporter substrate-binding protein n=1 Tax=Brevibacterium samyangense TaxID=366888 RepID=A0ABP5EQY8_9MICO